MKLILIDDETHTRHGILQRVNWTDLGIRSVRAVSGAREALRFAKIGFPILCCRILECLKWTA